MVCRQGKVALRARDGTLRTYEFYTKPTLMTKNKSMDEMRAVAKRFKEVKSMIFDDGFAGGAIDILLGQPALLDCMDKMEKLGDTGYGLQHTCFGALPVGPVDAAHAISNHSADVVEDNEDRTKLEER